jgi:hypothetical protein
MARLYVCLARPCVDWVAGQAAPDLSVRHLAVLAPLLALTVGLGLYPQPLLARTAATIGELVRPLGKTGSVPVSPEGRTRGAMKTALERALERIKEQGIEEGPPLTAAQKKKLAEIDRAAEAKLAEREIVLNEEIRKAALEGNAEKYAELQEKLTAERRSTREKAEADRKKVMDAAARRQQAKQATQKKA